MSELGSVTYLIDLLGKGIGMGISMLALLNVSKDADERAEKMRIEENENQGKV